MPLLTGAVAVSMLQWPVPSTVTLLYVAPFTVTVSVSPDSKVTVPVMTGVVSLVLSASTVGVVGTCVSMVRLVVSGVPVAGLPAASA